MLGLHCYMGFSLIAMRQGFYLVVVCGLHAELTSLVVEYRL